MFLCGFPNIHVFFLFFFFFVGHQSLQAARALTPHGNAWTQGKRRTSRFPILTVQGGSRRYVLNREMRLATPDGNPHLESTSRRPRGSQFVVQHVHCCRVTGWSGGTKTRTNERERCTYVPVRCVRPSTRNENKRSSAAIGAHPRTQQRTAQPPAPPSPWADGHGCHVDANDNHTGGAWLRGGGGTNGQRS